MSHSSESPEREPRRTDLSSLALSCFAGDLDSAASELVRHAGGDTSGYVCLCNAHVLTEALHDAALHAALDGAAIRFPDGEPVAWLLRRLGLSRARRVGGPDLLPRVVDRGRAVGLRHFFVGSTEENLARLREMIVALYPGVDVVGSNAPPYTDEPGVDAGLIDEIRTLRAQVVWVGLGAPKQEIWMARATSSLPGATLVGVGAAFDFIGGERRRAPEWMQRAGLEWLHRMTSEPRRLAPRYLRSNPEFMGRAGFELARRRIRAVH
jgi:N-acetylglucosaminyldiphosphoundecaprenol N-acetyl-beta-D-mannosaminyltransferase